MFLRMTSGQSSTKQLFSFLTSYAVYLSFMEQVLKAYAEGMLATLLKHEPLLRIKALRVLLRELLTACVLRPVLMLFWPHSLLRVGVGRQLCDCRGLCTQLVWAGPTWCDGTLLRFSSRR